MHIQERYGLSDPTKSPASGMHTVSKPRLMSRVGRVDEAMLYRSVCFCNWCSEHTSFLADPFVSVVRIQVECPLVTSKILNDLCFLPCVAATSGWAEVDTWPLICGGCYHVTWVGGPYGLWDSCWRLSFKITWSLWNYSKYILSVNS